MGPLRCVAPARARHGARAPLPRRGSTPGRGIEATLAAMPLLPREVAFVILGNGSSAPVLAARRENPELAPRVFLPCGRFLPGSSSTGYGRRPRHGPRSSGTRRTPDFPRTPNKLLFEAMTSGIPVHHLATAGYARYREREGIGALADPSEVRTDRPPSGHCSAILDAPAVRTRPVRRAHHLQLETNAERLVSLSGASPRATPLASRFSRGRVTTQRHLPPINGAGRFSLISTILLVSALST